MNQQQPPERYSIYAEIEAIQESRRKKSRFWKDAWPLLLIGLCLLWMGIRFKHPEAFFIGWDNNIKVLASSSEEDLSFFGTYASHLVQNLQKPDIDGLESAQAELQKTGIQVGQNQFFPKATPRHLGAWLKADTTRPRFALLISGPDAPDASTSSYTSSETEMLKQALLDPRLFGLPNDHIAYYATASRADVASGIQWLAGQLRSHPGAEGLIMICCHGNEKSAYFRLPWQGEGDAEGSLLFAGSAMREAVLKNWINMQLGQRALAASGDQSHHPLVVIILACHAGAFIADSPN